jgi:hypothetical protein
MPRRSLVDDLDLFGVAVHPSEADTPLIVDPDAELAGLRRAISPSPG